MSHLLSCKLRKKKLYNCQIWKSDEEGLFILRDENRDTEDSLPGVSCIGQFLSTDSLSANLTAFGTLPEIDDKILPLVLAINDVPGIMTKFSCMGHPERGGKDGYIMFTARNPGALRNFGRWLTQIEHPWIYEPWDSDDPEDAAKSAPEMPIEIALEYVLNGTNDDGEELTMSLRFSRPSRALPPSGRAYKWLAGQIRTQLAAHGCTCPPRREPRFQGQHQVRERRPIRRGALRYRPAKNLPGNSSVLAQSAWTSRSLVVTSSVVTRAQGRLAYRLAISTSGDRPPDDVCHSVLQDFGMQGAAERKVRGTELARHFELSWDAKAIQLAAS